MHIDIARIASALLRAHVLHGANQLPKISSVRCRRDVLVCDHARYRSRSLSLLSICLNEDVRRLKVAMNDALLVPVMHRLANRRKECEPPTASSSFAAAYSVIVGHARDVFHCEVRHAAPRPD